MLGRVGIKAGTDVEEFARGYGSLSNRESREAFMHTLRAVIDPRGQRVSARDRLYLAEEVPTLFVWGERDRIIPARHGRSAQAHVPNSRLETLPSAGHFLPLDEPERFVEILDEFISSTEPAVVDPEAMRQRLRSGGD
jgi:pimeloyl-ACP methyl ester carboxylesterase